jgi:hypothetical protein
MLHQRAKLIVSHVVGYLRCFRIDNARVESIAVKGPDTLWELIFLMVILKIPIAYLCYVVWFAIKAEPRRGRGGPALVRAEPDLPPPGYDRIRRRPRRRPPRPHGGPARAYARTGRARVARADRIAGR